MVLISPKQAQVFCTINCNFLTYKYIPVAPRLSTHYFHTGSYKPAAIASTQTLTFLFSNDKSMNILEMKANNFSLG